MLKRDYERLLDLAVHVLEGGGRPDSVRHRVLEELALALRGLVIVVKDEEWSEDRGRVSVRRPGGRAELRLSAETVRHLRIGRPFAEHYSKTADRGPAVAHAIGGHRWSDSETANVLRRAFGTRDMLCLPLNGPSAVVRGFLIHRDTRFTRRDVAYARLVQPFLSAVSAHRARLANRSLSPGRSLRQPDPEAPSRAAVLTPRETTVLHLLAEGLSAYAMARRLAVSVRTIHKHLQRLYRKLGATDRLDAVLRAQRTGLLPHREPVRPPALSHNHCS
ncbi:helix-turn-helix transcriptional regulator [Streptomyces sp. TP-A0874]|uniref:helix-turn-helix transcriptional regulator n=1 Tax=Streptomyces sp. TP-A0874 TaxID=549819 RepID=UPI0008537E80|nr:LuxR C-terminal-related transcriptional regulator [Streptomyces sp. TP-A0874]